MKTCSFPGCAHVPKAIAPWCNAHQLQRSRGRPLKPVRERGQTVESRFWAKVEKTPGCWRWTGSANAKGYGRFKAADRTPMLAHRFSWRLANGDIPDGMWVLHRCDNPPCVNPDHLFLGVAQDNTTDMLNKGRAAMFGPPRENFGATFRGEQGRYKSWVRFGDRRRFVGQHPTLLGAMDHARMAFESGVRSNRLGAFHDGDAD